MAGAALLSLQDEVDAGVGDGGSDAAGFVADDGEDVRRWDYARGCGDYMGQQRLAANFMQDFGKLRLKPGAFAGGHDGDGNAGRTGGRLRT